LEVSGLAGSVAIEKARRNVDLQNVTGPTRVDGLRGRRLRVQRLRGDLEVTGSIQSVEVEQVQGRVRVQGGLLARIRLAGLSGPVELVSEHAECRLAALPGEADLRPRRIALRQATGPLEITTESARRIELEEVAGQVAVKADRCDVSLRSSGPLEGIQVRLQSGDIRIRLSGDESFRVEAVTRRGKSRHEFGSALQDERNGPGASLRGGPSDGPLLELETGRGDIAILREGEPEAKPQRL
jgi:DUF4097 and DUF4098 domain-containing protein YvlB